ncbi:MAG: hypothetical protein AMXMBFR83_21520 [Phycisphaerae bacterium]
MSRPCIHPVFAFMVLCWCPLASLRAEQAPAVRLLSNIDVKNFGAEQLRIGDLDGDGEPDLLVVQSRYATREITCLTAVTLTGRVLWQVGEPSLDNGRIYSDLPVQVYDWDNDGYNEVLYIRQARYLEPWNGQAGFEPRKVRERAARYEGRATMLILDGRSGREKATLPLPAPADDCFLFADLTGKGRREDLVVKDRYWNAWGIAHDGRELWHWTGSTGHFPAVADVDNDGRDEVFFGFTLLDDDGKVLFSHDPNKDWSSRYARVAEPADGRAYQRFLAAPVHSDANYIVRLAGGQWRLLFGNHGPHCLTPDGTELWRNDRLGEAQHVVVGRFRPDSELQAVIIDRTPVPGQRRNTEAYADLYLFDLDGRILWQQRQEPGDWMIACTSLNWYGPGALESILVYGRQDGRPARLMDGQGKVLVEFPMHYLPERRAEEPQAWKDPLGVKNFYAHTADVWGDAREEVILFGARGLCIYTNPRAAAVPSQYNETLYPGM